MREMQQLKLKRIEKAVKRIEALIYKEENKGEASAALQGGDVEEAESPEGGGGVFGFFGGGKKKAEAEGAKAAAAREDEKGTTYGFVTAVTELHGAMKEVERRRDVERERRERRGESQLVAVKPHARDAAGAPMVEKYEGEELCSHCLRALIRAGARGKDLFGVQQDWLGSSEMMKATRCATAQFWRNSGASLRNSGAILAQFCAIILRRRIFYTYVLEYEHGVAPKPRRADLTDKDMTSQRAVASLATEDEEKAAMPLSEVRGASPKKERGGKKDSARGGKKKKAAFDLAAVVRQATEEEKSRQSADEESFGAGVLGSSDDECKPCLPSSASSDALARKQKTRSRWRFGAKLSGLNYRSSARRRTEGDEDDDRAGSEDERPSTAPARKSLGRAASDGGPTSASSDSHSSTWRKFSLSKLFAKHAPPGSDDDDGSPSKAEGLTMSGMMRETEKRRAQLAQFCAIMVQLF